MHFFLPVLLLLFFCDIITKYAAKYFLAESSFVIIPHFFSLSLHFNTGVAFSFPFPYWAQISTSLVFLAGILWWARKYFYDLSPQTQWGITLLLSGAFGNLWERIIFGHVTDFLYFYSSWVSFPIFNIADICIFIGVVLWFLGAEKDLAKNK